MYGLCDALAAEGVKVHATTVQRFLKRHGLERKRRLARRRRRGAGGIDDRKSRGHYETRL